MSAIRESECDCAILFNGSLDGVKRLAARQAIASGLHILDPRTNLYNVNLVQQSLIGFKIVLLEWGAARAGAGGRRWQSS